MQKTVTLTPDEVRMCEQMSSGPAHTAALLRSLAQTKIEHAKMAADILNNGFGPYEPAPKEPSQPPSAEAIDAMAAAMAREGEDAADRRGDAEVLIGVLGKGSVTVDKAPEADQWTTTNAAYHGTIWATGGAPPGLYGSYGANLSTALAQQMLEAQKALQSAPPNKGVTAPAPTASPSWLHGAYRKMLGK